MSLPCQPGPRPSSENPNGQVALPKIDLLADLSDVYHLDHWNLMWRAGYRIPREYPEEMTPEEFGWTPLQVHRLEDLGLTEEELGQVLDYAAFVKDRGRRSGRAPS